MDKEEVRKILGWIAKEASGVQEKVAIFVYFVYSLLNYIV